MARICDCCGGESYTVDDPFVMYRTRRPSDHSDMCCILWGHWRCLTTGAFPSFPNETSTGGIATPQQWEDWIETPEARALGYIWIT